MSYLSIFCIIVAAIIVITKIVLEVMEERDKANGMAVNHEEYKMGGLLKMIWKERWEKVKNFFRNIFGRKKREKK